MEAVGKVGQGDVGDQAGMRFNSGVEKDFATGYFIPVSVITDDLTTSGKQP